MDLKLLRGSGAHHLFLHSIAWIILLSAHGAAIAQTVTDEAFAQSSYFYAPSMSADGNFFAARVEDDPQSVFSVFRWNNGKVTPVLGMRNTDELFVNWAQWLDGDTLLMSIGRIGGRKVSIRVEGKREKYSTRYAAALYVYNVPKDGEQGENSIWKLDDRVSLISTLPHDPDHILIEKMSPRYYQWNGWRDESELYKANIRAPGDMEIVQPFTRGIHTWLVDRSGATRIAYGWDANNEAILRMRPKGEKDFIDYSHLREDVDKRMRVLAFAEDENQVYVSSAHETDTRALYLFDIPSGEFVKQIYHNPDFDIAGIRHDIRTGKLLSITYEGEQSHTIWLDDVVKSEIAKIRKIFPTQSIDVHYYEDFSNFMIVEISAPGDPGRYYIFDRTQERLFALPVQQPALDKVLLGRQYASSYQAKDGLQIPAYVTLPAGIETLEDADQLPFIVMPHGGPEARDFSGFDRWAQFFATQGYGVLQMNFRGSSGYGLEYKLAGHQQWGKLMQDDISSGVEWLVEKGYANPEKMAIVGASYGGYAALMGAIKTPELFQCAISFAGVSNLLDLVAGAGSDSYATRQVGSRFKDRDDLRKNSPIYRVADFGVPVLLIHGRLDGVVPYEQSESLARAMRKKRKNVEFITLPRSGHGWNDYEDRLRFFREQRRYIRDCMQ
jgi:dipeptidyl aminopeptidase/acylaminoacyl peptidase